MYEACLIIIHDLGMRIEPGTFGLVDECSTTELTLIYSLNETHKIDKSRLCEYIYHINIGFSQASLSV